MPSSYQPAALKDAKVRRSQLVTTYGPGAIVPAGDQSFIVAGIDRWHIQGPNIYEPRLQAALGVDGFVRPPASDHGKDVPVFQFPRIASCPNCNRLAEYAFFGSNKCSNCSQTLIPSRFVAACPSGHLEDFPYFDWVHKGQTGTENIRHDLTIRSRGVTASLQDIEIACSCGKRRTMEGAFGSRALQKIRTCSGHRPWLNDVDPAGCREPLRTLQRGASSVYFPVTRSAISIPPWSEGAQKFIEYHWTTLRTFEAELLRAVITSLLQNDHNVYTVEELIAAVEYRKRGFSALTGEEGLEQIRTEEYRQLLSNHSAGSFGSDFECIVAEYDPLADSWFSNVKLVRRLREVRVLESFTRLQPKEASSDVKEAPLAARKMHWLPAIEVIGEGVFLQLDLARLAAWEAQPEVVARALPIVLNFAKREMNSGDTAKREITPRLIMIHTLAHALITQWSLDSGYPAASLRERLYVDDTMAGVLIYTATNDAAGSLGGVVAQAMDERLGVSLIDSIRRLSWCSSDPLCIETEAAGTDSLNLAACHACALLPEVSCEEFNTLLDRALLIGTASEPTVGFFSELLDR